MQDNGRPHRWEDVTYDENAAVQLADTLEVPLPLARVLVGRGMCCAEEAQRFLQPSLEDLTDPFTLPGMEDGVRRVLAAIAAKERITVYADYDCDGLTAAVILQQVLLQLGAQVEVFIPKRLEDGYGFTIGALDKVMEQSSPDVILTADCGMRSGDAVERAARQGMDVIVTDHHEGYVTEIPHAVAVVNPKIAGAPEATEGLAGVGVAFLFCRGLLQRAREEGIEAADAIDLYSFLDLVAIGTIADLMPLTGDNRILVRYGLDLINDEKNRRPGLLALTRVAGIRTTIGSYEVGFLLGPRINAAGRMGSADLSMQLLSETDPWLARRLAGQLDACNRERKRIEDVVVDEALRRVAKQVKDDACGLVAGQRGWHVGTIGIVAARLCGRFHRPAAVISFDEQGFGRGSSRSTARVDMVTVLNRCSKWLVQFGGHRGAAGFCIREECLDAFTAAFQEACATCMAEDDLTEIFVVDGYLRLEEADETLLNAIDSLQPMGVGNPTPIWCVKGVRLLGPPKVVGGNHLKMVLASGNFEREAIGFGMADRKFDADRLDCLCQLQYNHYQGKRSLQLSVKDFRPSAS